MEESDEMEALLRWAAELGVSDSPPTSPSPSSSLGRSLIVSTFPDAGGRGLAAARDLRRGELVLSVPRKALLTRDSVLRDGKLASCVKRHPLLSSTQILTACLLAEVGKGKDSQWYPYLVQLPRSYDTLTNFTQFEIQALQVEDAMWIADNAVLKARSDWKNAKALMQEMELKPQLLTFRSWLWAAATISSRTLHIPWDDAGCLCPVGDLFNYAAPDEEISIEDLEIVPSRLNVSSIYECEGTTEELDAEQPEAYCRRLTDGGYDEDTTSYCFYARKSYRKGEQVLLCYGTYTNLDLLEHYGFLLDVNPNDKVFIQLDADIHTSSSWSNDSLYIQPDGSPSFALICCLRIWATPVNLRRAIGHRAYSGSLLSVENELFAMRWLENHCCKILRQMATTLEEDELLLGIIGRILDNLSYENFTEIVSSEKELSAFFRENGLLAGGEADYTLPAKAKKSLERWRLAVQWRFSQKKILSNCVCFCSRTIDRLSSQHD